MKEEPKPQKIDPVTMGKLIANKTQMMNDKKPYTESCYTHQIKVAVDKAELFGDLIVCIENLINSKAHMPSVVNLLKEAKSIK